MRLKDHKPHIDAYNFNFQPAWDWNSVYFEVADVNVRMYLKYLKFKLLLNLLY